MLPIFRVCINWDVKDMQSVQPFAVRFHQSKNTFIKCNLMLDYGIPIRKSVERFSTKYYNLQLHKHHSVAFCSVVSTPLLISIPKVGSFIIVVCFLFTSHVVNAVGRLIEGCKLK